MEGDKTKSERDVDRHRRYPFYGPFWFYLLYIFYPTIFFLELLSDSPNQKLTMDYWNTVVAPLIVAALTGGFTWLWTQRKLQRKIEAAPRKYVQELDRLISRAMAEGTGNAVINARAIVAARNSLRGSLVSISQQLNSEIDRLAEEIGEAVQLPLQPSIRRDSPTQLDAQRAFQTIQVLSRVWPAKKEQIEVEIRKLLAELGLDFTDARNYP